MSPPSKSRGGINAHLVRGSAWALMMRLSLRLVGLVNTIILARLLVPADFGLITMAALCMGLLEGFTELGVGLHLIRTPNPTRDHCNTAFTVRLIKGLLIATALLTLAPLAASYFSEPRIEPIVRVLALVAALNGVQNIGMVLVRKELDFARDFRFVITGRLFNFALTVTLAFLLRTYWAIVIAQVLSAAFDVFLSYRLHPFRPRLSLSHVGEYLRFSMATIPLNIASFLNQRLHVLVVGRIAGTSMLGTYNVASDLASSFSDELVSQIGRALFPGFAKVAGDRKLLGDTLCTVFASVAFIALPLALGVSSVSTELVEVLLGAQWIASAAILQWLAVASVGRALTGLLGGGVLIAARREHFTVVLTWMRLALTAPFAILGAIYWGVHGVAVAITVVQLTYLPIVAAVVGRVLEIRYRRFVAGLWRPLVAAVAMSVVVRTLHEASGSAWKTLLIDVGTGIVAYALFVTLLWLVAGRPAGPERAVIELVRRKLWKR